MKRILFFPVTLALLLGVAGIGTAQLPVPPPAPMGQPRSSEELEQLLQPIALYPDPLLGLILSSATLPSEVVLADRYVSGGGDPNLIEQQAWDPGVQALARYPDVLKWMDDNLSWTTALGQALVSQQEEVMASIQRLRARAQALGNLQSTPQENVFVDGGQIEILPANPQVIYVPVYQPEIVYYQRWSHGSPFISFGTGFRAGAWLNLDFDWHRHGLIQWGREHPRPGNWWARRPAERTNYEPSRATHWEPHRPAVPLVREGDRGWDTHPSHPSRPGPGVRPEPIRSPGHLANPPHPGPPVPSRPAQGALIGVQGARETQQYRDRGQESRQTPPRAAPPSPPTHPAPAPAPHPAAPAPPSGSGHPPQGKDRH